MEQWISVCYTGKTGVLARPNRCSSKQSARVIAVSGPVVMR